MVTSALFLAAITISFGAGCYALENMIIDIGVRSYDGKMWFCNDNKDRVIPAGMRDGGWEKLPKNEQPQMRKRKDGKLEPDYNDCGNAWVAFVSKDNERRAFLTSSDGFHSVWSKFQRITAVEDISGKDYIVEMPFKSTSTNYEKLEEIAQNLADKNRKDETYRGTDYVIDLVLAVVDDATKKKLKESANNWPASLQLLDIHLDEKLGLSAFAKRKIPRGTPPRRSQLSKEVNLNEKRFEPRLSALSIN